MSIAKNRKDSSLTGGRMKTCECELWEIVGKDTSPICGEFEPADEDDCDDCCKHCRHGEECHLNG